MKHTMLCLSFLLICLAVFSCFNDDYLRFQSAFRSFEGKKDVTVVIVGDSMSSPEYSTTGTTYATFLKPKLEKLLGARVSMINSARPGDTIDKISRRIQEDIQSYRPDVVFVMLGMDDSTLPNMYEMNYEEAVGNYFKVLDKEGLFTVVLSSTGYCDKLSENGDLSTRLGEFTEITIYRANAAHLPVIDLADHMEKLKKAKPDEYISMFQDDTRLNEKGQAYVADFIYDQVRRALEDKK